MQTSTDQISAALITVRLNVLDAMQHFGLNETQFAQRARVDQKKIWRLLHAAHEPRLDTLCKIAQACGLEPWQMLQTPLERRGQ